MTRILAWVGGALFVFSLACTLYFYAVVLGRPDDGATVQLPIAITINIMLFGVFAMHHSLFARDAAKRWVARLIPPQMERSMYVWLASALLLGVCVLWQRVPGMIYEIAGPARWLFHGLQLAGFILISRSAGILDPLELAGIRQAERRPAAAVEFRTDGPFGLVRHPIYLGWILMTFGAPAMTTNRLMFAVISSLYLVVAIPWEEHSLVTAFGERYRAYQSAVRWRLIPGVW